MFFKIGLALAFEDDGLTCNPVSTTQQVFTEHLLSAKLCGARWAVGGGGGAEGHSECNWRNKANTQQVPHIGPQATFIPYWNKRRCETLTIVHSSNRHRTDIIINQTVQAKHWIVLCRIPFPIIIPSK